MNNLLGKKLFLSRKNKPCYPLGIVIDETNTHVTMERAPWGIPFATQHKINVTHSSCPLCPTKKAAQRDGPKFSIIPSG